MANQRSTFAKRRREQELQDRARAKQERRAAKKVDGSSSKGPQIAWDEAVVAVITDPNAPLVTPGDPLESPADADADPHEDTAGDD